MPTVRLLLLAAWLLYGLIFFSVARNKLPGYLLPLLPALAIVLAAALESAPFKAWWLAACALLLIALPTVAGILPDALLAGLSRTHIAFAPGGLVFVVAAAVVWWLAWKQKTRGRAAHRRLGRWDRRRVSEVQHVSRARHDRFRPRASGEITRAKFPLAVSTMSAGPGSTA